MVPTDSPVYAGLIARRLQEAADALEEARLASLLALDPDAPVPYTLTIDGHSRATVLREGAL